MDKLPPPPPPPPPGRGRAAGSAADRADNRPGRRRRRPAGRGRPSTWPRWLLWVIAGVLLATIFVPSLLPERQGNEMTYTEFRDKVVAGEVESVEVNNATSGKITGELENGDKFITNGGGDRGLSEADEALLERAGRRPRVQDAEQQLVAQRRSACCCRSC